MKKKLSKRTKCPQKFVIIVKFTKHCNIQRNVTFTLTTVTKYKYFCQQRPLTKFTNDSAGKHRPIQIASNDFITAISIYILWELCEVSGLETQWIVYTMMMMMSVGSITTYNFSKERFPRGFKSRRSNFCTFFKKKYIKVMYILASRQILHKTQTQRQEGGWCYDLVLRPSVAR